MKFRPCIDIHNGKVKQIVGGSLSDLWDPEANFIAERSSSYYAQLFKKKNLKGGHVILLNSKDSSQYGETKKCAIEALNAFPGGLQAGGGIVPENAEEFLNEGASHVIVTSYLFEDNQLSQNRLKDISKTVGKEQLVVDISCREYMRAFHVTCNRWQTLTDTVIDKELLMMLNEYCSEILIHAVDVEGRSLGPHRRLLKKVQELRQYFQGDITYAGGIAHLEDVDTLFEITKGDMDFTIGSALKIFGGNMEIEDIVNKVNNLVN